MSNSPNPLWDSFQDYIEKIERYGKWRYLAIVTICTLINVTLLMLVGLKIAFAFSVLVAVWVTNFMSDELFSKRKKKSKRAESGRINPEHQLYAADEPKELLITFPRAMNWRERIPSYEAALRLSEQTEMTYAEALKQVMLENAIREASSK